MKRTAFLIYGIVSYAIFFAVFLYAIGFIGNVWVPKSIDSPAEVSLGSALLINTLLLGLFALQHSGMARPSFKKYWTRVIPEPIERSTYVLASSVCLAVLFWFWQPMGGVIWQATSGWAKSTFVALYAAGWALVLWSTFLINHFDLFGLKQVYNAFKKRDAAPQHFVTPSLYRIVRHPLYVGWLLVMWMTPTMTVAHLLFALGCTGYILAAIQLEERNLAEFHPEYTQYRRKVPMLIPSFRRRLSKGTDLAAPADLAKTLDLSPASERA